MSLSLSTSRALVTAALFAAVGTGYLAARAARGLRTAEGAMARAPRPTPASPGDGAAAGRRGTAIPSLATYQISAEGAPARGGRAARVTIVQFSDFQCPFCARVSSTLD